MKNRASKEYYEKKNIIINLYNNDRSKSIDELSELTGIKKSDVSRIIYNYCEVIINDLNMNLHKLSHLQISDITKIDIGIVEKVCDRSRKMLDDNTKLRLVVDTYLKYNGNITLDGLSNLLNIPRTTVRNCINSDKVMFLYGEEVKYQLKSMLSFNENQRKYDNAYISSKLIKYKSDDSNRFFTGTSRRYDEELSFEISISIKAAKFLMMNFSLYESLNDACDDVCKIFKIDYDKYTHVIYDVLKTYDEELYNSLINLYDIKESDFGGR